MQELAQRTPLAPRSELSQVLGRQLTRAMMTRERELNRAPNRDLILVQSRSPSLQLRQAPRQALRHGLRSLSWAPA